MEPITKLKTLILHSIASTQVLPNILECYFGIVYILTIHNLVNNKLYHHLEYVYL